MTVVRSGSATDVGRVRTSNQDLSLEEGNLFAVADGMGGHVGGEVAARTAIDALRSAFLRDASVTGLREAVVEANSAVWERGQAQIDLRGMGTTLTAVALVTGEDSRDVIALANVGDSRAYVWSQGRIAKVTVDHSLAEEKYRQGELTEAEAAVHPQRHILTRALGVSSSVDVDMWKLHLAAGDRILLCSDGLTNEVGVDEIAQVLGSIADPVEAAQALVDAANEHGGSDNITVVVVEVLVGNQSVPSAVSGVTSAGTLGAERPVVAPVFALTASASRSAPEEGYGEEPSPRERRRQRRLGGIPRWITVRVVVFAVLILVVVGVAYGFARWYATDNWYVTIEGNHLVIYQGRPGGLLWFDAKLVERTPVTSTSVPSFQIHTLLADKDEPSLAAARRYVHNLHQEYLSLTAPSAPPTTAPPTTTASSPATTTAPPTTTAPSPSTTTAPSAG